MKTKSTINSSPDVISTGAFRQPALPPTVQRYATFGGFWAAWLLDALDATILGLVIFMIANTFSIGLRDVASIITWFLLATGIGGLFLGNIANRIRRKKTILASVSTHGTGTLLCDSASSVPELDIYRFCVSVVVGGLWSVALALVSGIWVPEGRAKVIMFVQTGWSGGEFPATCFVWTLPDPPNPGS